MRNTWTCNENTNWVPVEENTQIEVPGLLWTQCLTSHLVSGFLPARLVPNQFLFNTNLELGPELRTYEAVGHVARATNPKHGQIRSVLFKSASSRLQHTLGHVFLCSAPSLTGLQLVCGKVNWFLGGIRLEPVKILTQHQTSTGGQMNPSAKDKEVSVIIE